MISLNLSYNQVTKWFIYLVKKVIKSQPTYQKKKKKTQPITLTKYESQSNKHNTTTTH